MKKAFTLVELLVVVVVLITLMTITFRLVSIGGDSDAKHVTMNRMHRLENALSGYYAAFGTYPPVNLHGYRNPFLSVSSDGVQNTDGQENADLWGWLAPDGETVRDRNAESRAWNQVKAACEAQPVACNFPFSDEYSEIIDLASEYWKEVIDKDLDDSLSDDEKLMLSRGFDNGVSRNIGRFARFKDKIKWTDLQLFRFGLMSYLLPRYLLMMNSDEQFYQDFAQWLHNNTLPNDPLTGRSFSNWANMRENYVRSDKKSDLAHIANISSQAACSRWMANFENSLFCTRNITLYGVEVRAGSGGNLFDALKDFNIVESLIRTPGGYDDANGSNQYILDAVTIKDGWGNEFYYYSPPPYQSYRIWSGGANGRTFPSWIDRSTLGGEANRCIGYWVMDDIVSISH